MGGSRPSIIGTLPTRINTVSTAARRKSASSFLYSRSRESSAEDHAPRTTPYPAPSTAFSRSLGSTSPARYVTVAFSLARFTFASRTPGTLPRARSTRPTQLAQLIPITGTVTRANLFFASVVSTPGSGPSCSFGSPLYYTPLPYNSNPSDMLLARFAFIARRLGGTEVRRNGWILYQPIDALCAVRLAPWLRCIARR